MIGGLLNIFQFFFFFFDEISLHLFGVPLPTERKNWATDIYTFLKFWLF